MRLAIVLLCLSTLPAAAGSCRTYAYGRGSAESCTGGYYSYSSGANGYHRSWGIRNGGVDPYPGQGSPSFRMR